MCLHTEWAVCGCNCHDEETIAVHCTPCCNDFCDHCKKHVRGMNLKPKLDKLNALVEEVTGKPGEYTTKMSDAWEALENFVDNQEYAGAKIFAERSYWHGSYSSVIDEERKVMVTARFGENVLDKHQWFVMVWAQTTEIAICIALLIATGTKREVLEEKFSEFFHIVAME